MSDCTHEWGFDLTGTCKGCGKFVPEDERKAVNRALVLAAAMGRDRLAGNEQLPFDGDPE